MDDALDRLAEEAQKLQDQSPRPAPAPTMGRLAKMNYTHDALIDQILANPHLNQGQLAAIFGYGQSWVSNIMASDVFQAALTARRKEVIDPTLVATIDERIRGMTLQALSRIQEKLEEPACKPETALRAFELGARGLGLGGNAPPRAPTVNLDELAARLKNLNSPRIIEGEVLSKETMNG